jgi:endonuclease-3
METTGSDKIIKLMLEYIEKNPVRTGSLLEDNDANQLNKSDPFAFLLACCIDRQMSWEIVWHFPLWIKEKIGHLDPTLLSKMSVGEIEQILRILPKCHRFPQQAAQTIKELSVHIVSFYEGEASRLWDSDKIDVIKRRLLSILGVGEGIASMTLNILLREGKINLNPGEYAKLDVKPDVHVQRVFYRTGMAEKQEKEAAILAARKFYPQYPGKLDSPAWKIGQEYCFAESPNCQLCPLTGPCLRRY